ncbi:MAG TPA: 5-dehydro-2-deoxygluconokinase [Hyphomicrobiales bacterium]|nr:5-dehydro-2-deoxygluconokinase [Hyphomicrobiales bacterium]
MLDVITIGRSSVDLYGQQIGCRFEDTASLAKAVGGSPANIAIGSARLGLKAGLITRVGDEQMGRFIREQLIREGVDITGVRTDTERLTALVILGVENDHSFPHIFFRENCADMAVCEDDIAPDFIGSAKAIVISGTHLSRQNTRAACMKAVRIAKQAGVKVALDIDHRPNLWGLLGHAHGAARFMASETVTAMLGEILPLCDLIVGTEEEFHIAGGNEETLAALQTVRGASQAVLVCKRGPMGCTVFQQGTPASLDDGIDGPGFPVEVYNTLGAGDAFMSGLLRGWLRDEPWETAARWANACGAIAVSRLLCSPEYPSWTELQAFLDQDIRNPRLREDKTLNHLHRVTTRAREYPQLLALAIDHRKQLADLCRTLGAETDRLERFKVLGIEAAARVANGADGFGVLCDSTYGRAALFRAEDLGLWIARPVEKPGSIPVEFENGDDLGSQLIEWPLSHTIKCLTFYHPDDAPELRAAQERRLIQLQDAALKVGREFLIEIIASKSGPMSDTTIATILGRLYGLGLKPDWWKLEPLGSGAAWDAVDEVIEANDPACRGIVILGQESLEDTLRASFRASSASRYVKGFAVGRTIFMDTAERWLKGEIGDETAIAEMAGRFASLVSLWRARGAES